MNDQANGQAYPTAPAIREHIEPAVRRALLKALGTEGITNDRFNTVVQAMTYQCEFWYSAAIDATQGDDCLGLGGRR